MVYYSSQMISRGVSNSIAKVQDAFCSSFYYYYLLN